MALALPTLITTIQNVLASQSPPPADPVALANLKATQLTLATGLATAIDAYIRTATITVSPGIVISTPAGPGASVGPGVGIIS